MSRTDLNTVKRTTGPHTTTRRNIIYKVDYSYDRTIFSDKTTTTNDGGSTTYANTVSVNRVSSVSPGWHSILVTGKTLPVNAFTFNKKSYDFFYEQWSGESYDAWGRLTAQTSASGYRFNSPTESVAGDVWYMPQLIPVPQSMSDAALNQVIVKVRNAVKDQKVNIQQVLAERDQTIRLVTDTVKTVTDVVKNLKRGNFPAAFRSVGVHLSPSKHKKLKRGFARDQSRAIANGWIAVQYGVKPLLDDVRGAAEALAKAIHNSNPPTQRAQASVTVHHNVTTKGTVNPDFIRSYVNTSEVSLTHKYVIYFRASPSFSSLPTSLGLTNPLSIAWELTPWSFVVDWFYPIGNFLSSLDATVGVNFVSGSWTTYTKSSARRNFDWDVKDARSKNRGFGWSSYEAVSVVRQMLVDFPQSRLPSFKNPVSSTHMFNALALLRQQFR